MMNDMKNVSLRFAVLMTAMMMTMTTFANRWSSENRVNVSLRNFETFFEAFGIKEGDPMFRPEAERVHIW